MCDTLYKNGKDHFIFAKNSDRGCNEPQYMLFLDKNQLTNQMIDCTYVKVFQDQPTYQVLLSKPSWMWGGEIGINECGVMIGNEAVFTKSHGKKEPKLLGMDLLRLGLERGDTAKKALDVILHFLTEIGQGGNCGFDKPFFYDNAFLIADKKEAYILETSGKNYVVKQVQGYDNISNRLSIETPGMMQSNENIKNFKKQHFEPVYSHFSGSKNRYQMIHQAIKEQAELDLEKTMAILRGHHHKDESKLYQKGSLKSVCMHKSMLGDHTTQSLIYVDRDQFPTIWVTGSSTPCLSLFKPTYFGVKTPPIFTDEQAGFEYWLDREKVIRSIYNGSIPEVEYKQELFQIQADFIDKEKQLFTKKPTFTELALFQEECHKIEQEWIQKWLDKVSHLSFADLNKIKMWAKLNQKVGKNVFEKDLEKRML